VQHEKGKPLVRIAGPAAEASVGTLRLVENHLIIAAGPNLSSSGE